MGTVTLTSQAAPIGAIISKIVAANNSANANITGASGTLHVIQINNTANSAAMYFKMVDGTSATVGTTAPEFIFRVSASSTLTCVFPGGIVFTSGFTAYCVQQAGTAGTSSPGSSVIVHFIST